MTPTQVRKLAESIHADVCYDTLETCLLYYGDCVRAATRLYRAGLLKEDPSEATLTQSA